MSSYLELTGTAATGVGALPHTDPADACRDVLRIFPEIPFIPTLPNRGLRERIVLADSARLPGGVIRDGRLFVEDTGARGMEMEQIYLDFLEKNTAAYGPDADHASGFHMMMTQRFPEARILKCQVTGPVTFGMQVVDAGRRPILYDPVYADILPKMIALEARWCEERIRQVTGIASTLVVLNEPYLASLGSTVVPVDPEMVLAAWNDISSLVGGGLGVHCCANTDFGFVMGMRPSVISFDAYSNANEFLLYIDQISAYIEAGGIIAWGIVPADPQRAAAEGLDRLEARYREIRGRLAEHLPTRLIDRHAIITPSCGIQTGDARQAVMVMEMAASIAVRITRGVA